MFAGIECGVDIVAEDFVDIDFDVGLAILLVGDFRKIDVTSALTGPALGDSWADPRRVRRVMPAQLPL